MERGGIQTVPPRTIITYTAKEKTSYMIIPAGHSIFPFIPNFSRLFSENDVMIFINAAFLLILFVLAMWIVLKCGETPSEAKMIPALVIYAVVSASILLCERGSSRNKKSAFNL